MIPSPCIGRCRIDPAANLCAGCARSGAEVAAWRDATPADRDRVWADLPRRRAELGIDLYRRDWSPEVARAFVRASLAGHRGTWTLGVFGASVRFGGSEGGPGGVIEYGPTLAMTTAYGAIRFTLDDRVRVLAAGVAEGKSDPARERIVLAVPKTRDLPAPATTLTPLGPDAGAISPRDCAGRLFDLGLGRPEVRVGVRTHDDALAADFDRRAGYAWPGLLEDIDRDWQWEAGNVWVVETPLARAEVTIAQTLEAPCPLGLGPEFLALDRPILPGVDFPPTFVPGAVFEPEAPTRGEGFAHRLRRLAGRGRPDWPWAWA